MKTSIYLTKEHKYLFINRDNNKKIGEIDADDRITLEYLCFLRGVKKSDWAIVKDQDYNIWEVGDDGNIFYFANRENIFVTGV